MFHSPMEKDWKYEKETAEKTQLSTVDQNENSLRIFKVFL